MITTVNYRPKFYSSGYNPIIWSVTSNNASSSTLVDYSYVFDVKVDGVTVNRIIQRPNPSYAGMIDVSPIAQSYLLIGAFANETGVPTSTPLQVGSEAVCAVEILAGEQYRTGEDAPLVLYTGSAVSGVDIPGQPSYYLGAQGYTSRPVIVIPSFLNWSEQQNTMQAQNANPGDYYGLFGELAPYVLKNNSLYAPWTVGGPGLFLSSMPRETSDGAWRTTSAAPGSGINAYDYAYDRYTLSFLNRNPVYQYFGQLQASAPKVAWFTFYNAAGTQIGTREILNYVTKGGAPRTTCNGSITTFSTSVNQELLSLRVGPKDLEDIGFWASLGQVPASYTVQLFATLTVEGNCSITGTPSVPLSELVTINIVEDCTSYLYPRVRLAWLNGLGGRDYWNFTMFAEETSDTEQTEYYQPEMNWSGTTPVQLDGNTTQNWLRGGIRQYNKNVFTSWTIQSDWLTQGEVELMKTAVESAQIWAYIGQEDFPYTCKIKETSYTVKTIKQVKMYNATFTIELANNHSTQNT